MDTEDRLHGLRCQVDNGVAFVTIDRPPVNALDRETNRSLMALFGSFTDRHDVRAVVLTGAGDRAFCAGRDIKDLAAERAGGPPSNIGDPGYLTRGAFWAVRHCAVPVVVAVNGPAIGAGLALVAVSDIAIAAETASFALAEIDVGVLGASSFAKWLAGPGLARHMFFTGEPVSAAEMYRRGAIHAMVPGDRLLDEAGRIAGTIAGKNPVAIRLAKAAVVRTDTLPLEEAYRLEQDFTRHLSSYPDSMEAISAFAGKRR